MVWDNEHKDWDRDRPIHRIESASYLPDEARASGRGYQCGCRSPLYHQDRHLLTNRLVRIFPGWVPVSGRNELSYREMEGMLKRSYQAWTDAPLAQWHVWYDWNFHVEPAQGYGYLRGRGNDHHGEVPSGQRRVVLGETMEGEWDCGAIQAGYPGPSYQGPMFRNDWAWPMAGQYVWLAGRWIYDCGHATSENPNRGLMRTELHPCLAVATARWEAVSFPETRGLYTPGIQFMFFISKYGGYYDFDLRDVATLFPQYRFIVDLPGFPVPPDSFVARTPRERAPRGAVLRLPPELLQKFEHAQFQNARGYRSDWTDVRPEVELLTPANLERPQVKITIPLSSFPPEWESWGVIVSLGWHDTVQASSIYKARVTFDEFRKPITKKTYFKYGVNGRWFADHYQGPEGMRSHVVTECHLGNAVEFWLHQEDPIRISAHGTEVDRVGEFMERPIQDRTVRHGTMPVDWEQIVGDSPEPFEPAFLSARSMMAETLGVQNGPLGIIDQSYTPSEIWQGGSEFRFTIRARRPEELGDSAELVENTNETDYELTGRIEVEPQM